MANEPEGDRESEAPLRRWRLVAEPPDAPGDPLAISRPGIEALFAFAVDLLEPLAVGAELAWVDQHGHRAGYPPHMEWRLARRDRSGRLSRSWPVATTLEMVDEVNRAAVERFIARLCAGRPAG